MKKIKQLLVLASLALMAACSGSGGSDAAGSNDPQDPPQVGGIGRTGVAFGPITTFGSVVVNGVHYETSSASFTINGVAGNQSDLSVGDVVLIQGTIDSNGTTGSANSVGFEEAVTGPVQSINIAGSTLVILGQTVFVTADTSFDDSFSPASIETVQLGQIVEVSGQFDANGAILATRIEPKPNGTEFEVHGKVSALNTANMRLNIGNLVVDYSSASLDNFPNGQINNDDPVEAKGTTLGAAGELLATSVELEALFPGVNQDDFAEIEGFITRFIDATDFDVAGFPVTTNGQTLFEGGVAADLGLNIKVEVEGVIDANGVLVANKVDIRRAKAVRATASLDSVDAANNSIVMLGITVNVDELTRIEDKSRADVDPLTLADVNAGDYVEIRGDEFPAGSGQILATIFEREDLDTEAILQGFVETVSDPSLTILGVTIDTNGSTVFRDENDVVIGSLEFFSRLAENDLVKASGVEMTDTTIVATELEFELEF